MGMKPDIRMRWVERLRSGKFRQGTGRLLTKPADGGGPDGSYCCLGVLCTIAEEDGIISRHEWENDSLLPSKVQEWSGIDGRDPLLDGTNKAANANDSGAKFPEIAHVITTKM